MDTTTRKLIRIHWSLSAILLTLPFVTWALLLLQPTSDDWSYLTKPLVYDKWDASLFLPYSNYWRPFDALIGSLLGSAPAAFPALNHILILLAHVAGVLIVNRLCAIMDASPAARNAATLFFYCSTGVMGTILGIDSINQAMATTFGLLGLLAFLPRQGRRPRYMAWLLLTITAPFMKANGITWTVVTPLMAYGLRLADSKTLCRALTMGIIAAAVYVAVRFSVADNGGIIYTPSSHNWHDTIEGICIFLFMTWVPADYMCIVYPPERNLFVAALTILAGAPFLWLLFRSFLRMRKDRLTIVLILCMLAAAMPNLLTWSSPMHTYSILPMAALLTARLYDNIHTRHLVPAFAIYMTTAMGTVAHHIAASYQSGITGQALGRETIAQCPPTPVNKVFVINTDNSQPQYSSFRVPPFSAYGWGIAAYQETGWLWPREMTDTCIASAPPDRIRQIADSAMSKGYESVWIYKDGHIKVINK